MTGFARAVGAEFRKVLSTRLWWVLGLILFGYVAFGAVAFAFAFGFAGESAGVPIPGEAVSPVVYSMATATGYVIPVVFGAMSITGEVRHRTLSTVFLATPHRAAVLAAKAVVALVVGAVFGVVGLLASVAPGAALLGAGGIDPGLDDPGTWLLFARIVLAMAIWGAVGVGVGVLIPSQVGSIVAVLAFTQFVEPLLRTAGGFVGWVGEVVRYLPGALGDALVGSSIYALFAAEGSGSLDWWQGGLLLAAYAVLFGVIGSLTTWRRDIT